MTTENQTKLMVLLKRFSNAVEKRFEEDGGASYYENDHLQMMLINCMRHLPKKFQKELLVDLKASTEHNEKIVNELVRGN